jgi:uncharacterized protein YjbJ (UPF0337 family)
VPVRHRDAAGDAADDADQSLVGAADEEVGEVRAAVEVFFRRTVDGAVLMAGEADDRDGE